MEDDDPEKAAAEIYDTNRFSVLYHNSRRPSPQHLGLAARFLISLFRSHSIFFAFLGGWAVYLRGGARRTEDVDVSVAVSMERLEAILVQEERICVPLTYGTRCIQIFVHTGGDWDDRSSPPLPELAVSVDIIINGNLGIPPDLPSATESITPSQPDINLGPDPVVPVIDVFHQFATKLNVHHARRQTEDYVDLEFLAETYPSGIFAVRNFLNRDHREAFWTDYALRNAAAEEAARVEGMRVLLGLSLSP
ncbi:uncharacterized protein DNG_00981 [Cephalotrichum gorgonifer]|uniref:Uncharacterized protein n=1 Tax=Cephalotrichum gorgonifer TaxID=2041049 RepID=A0AAE8SRA2_9PEZI|nr:uncharacterized protein DNG_00981 [Cephalotrichum gorgonifer]